MALIECPQCGTKASNVLNKCPQCRADFIIDAKPNSTEEQKIHTKNRLGKWRNLNTKKYFLIFILVFVGLVILAVAPIKSIFEQISSISFFNFKENEAIGIVKSSKIQFGLDNLTVGFAYGMMGLTQGSTWQDFSNVIVKQEPNKKHTWTAKKTKDKGIYLVAFQDEQGWGHRWEVSIEQQTVIHVNQNEYLKRKYGFSRLDRDGVFKIGEFEIDTLKIEKEYNYFSQQSSKHVVYIFKAKVENGTDKVLTSAKISGNLKVIFKDKTVEGASSYSSGFTSRISSSNPWNPNTERIFYIKTHGIDVIYLNYQPEYVFFDVGLKAEDPIGFTYDKSIEEFDLKDKWKRIKK